MPNLQAVNLQSEFYTHYQRLPHQPLFREQDYEQIIKRCSIIRLLPWEQSKRIVDAMYKTIDVLTEKTKPDYLLAVSVDTYITDLLARVCKNKGIRVLQLAGGNVPNTLILTSYGEFNLVRTPSDEDVTRALRLLSRDNGIITYHLKVSKHSFNHQLALWSSWWSKYAYFKAASLVFRDPLNARYLMATIRARDGQSSLTNYKANRYYMPDWEKRLSVSSHPAILIPLNYFPEMTVSYWLKDLAFSDYENFIVTSCLELSRSYTVLLKEHWSAAGTRNWDFYRRLSEIPNILLVPPEVPARLVMKKVDRVIVGTGTTGIEAALQGKRVATLDRPYYFLENYYLNIGSADRIENLPTMLENFRPPLNTEDNRRRLVTRLLEGTLVGHMLPDNFIDREQNWQATSDSLKTYLLSDKPKR